MWKPVDSHECHQTHSLLRWSVSSTVDELQTGGVCGCSQCCSDDLNVQYCTVTGGCSCHMTAEQSERSLHKCVNIPTMKRDCMTEKKTKSRSSGTLPKQYEQTERRLELLGVRSF